MRISSLIETLEVFKRDRGDIMVMVQGDMDFRYHDLILVPHDPPPGINAKSYLVIEITPYEDDEEDDEEYWDDDEPTDEEFHIREEDNGCG